MTAARADTGEIPPALPVGRAATDSPATASEAEEPVGTVSDATDRIAARRIVELAKELLMSRQGMTEPDAHRWIQKSAMDRRSPKVLIAKSIIAGLGDPGAQI
jgi:AmiR/NasT family two-component response regulator